MLRGDALTRMNFARSSTLWVIAFFVGATLSTQSSSLVLAGPGEPGYVVSDVTVEYPYAGEDGVVDAGEAGLSYSTQWKIDRYPGPALCEFHLYDGSGTLVGAAQIEYSSAVPAPPRSTGVEVDVSAPPTRATGGCARAADVRGRGYDVTHTGTSPLAEHPGGSLLTFEARRASNLSPGQRECEVFVQEKDGTSQTFGPITLFVADPIAEVQFEVPIPSETIAAARVACTDL